MKKMVLILSSREENNQFAREALKRVASIIEVVESDAPTRTFEEMELLLPALVYPARRGGGGGEFGLESIETFIEHELEEAETSPSTEDSNPVQHVTR